ncbi:MAG TPA: vanadium-dependent haloperoxidase [Stellaceae bacterium]|nr:vanadium-dependent haloperoxidase [Stellaceae bacterium]
MIKPTDGGGAVETGGSAVAEWPKGPSRRKFLGRAGAAATAAGVLASPSESPARAIGGGSTGPGGTAPIAGVKNRRVIDAFELRVSEAVRDARVPAANNLDNGDEARYPDKAGAYTKCLPHDSFGRVDPKAYRTFKAALRSGDPAAFDAITMGGARTLNGPQGGLAFCLQALDNAQFGQPQVPPAPEIAGDQTATELLEHYWGSLLRDIAFTDYRSNSLAAQAAMELGSQRTYLGPRDRNGRVTPDLLFRGVAPGATLGPYLSQFLAQPTYLGSQPIGQQQVTFIPNLDYGTDFAEWLKIQNGIDTGYLNQPDPQLRFRRNGRDLAAFTHVDVLYQAYFTAFLVLTGIGAPLNPGNPYNNSRTQNGFGTFGDPDFAATLAAVATIAVNAVWYQKWFVHLRPRPEAIGGLVHLIKTGRQDKTDVTLSPVILNSHGLQKSFTKFGTWLLSQAFPEGSPAHPSYPTGHGAVGGACVTVLKFFFDGDFPIPAPVVPANDGLSLGPYTASDAGRLTVNGELNKLAHNITYGHGIHSGIHWRSDSDTSLLLGEAVALSFLKDKARTYNEPFAVSLTKFDGTTVTVSNQ